MNFYGSKQKINDDSFVLYEGGDTNLGDTKAGDAGMGLNLRETLKQKKEQKEKSN